MTFPTYSLAKTSKFDFSKVLNFLILAAVITLLAMYIFAYFPMNYRYKDRILESTFGVNISLITLLLLRVLHYVFFRNQKKISAGNMELLTDKIVLNGNEYQVDSIEHLRIIGNDILGDFRGFSSKGTENQLVMKLKNGEEVSTYFLQTPSANLKSEKIALEIYHEAGILTEANLYNILNNTNYY